MITLPHKMQTTRRQRVGHPRSVQLLAVLIAVALGLLGLPLIALPASAAAATPTFEQVRAKEITTGTFNSLAFNSANTAGNLIVVYLAWSNTGSVSISDTRGNAYTSAGSLTTWGASSNRSSQVFYAKNVAGGANTVRATFDTAITSWADMYIHEYSGIDKADPLDVSAVDKGTAAAMNSGSATTTNANDLIFGAGASANTVNQAGTGFTSRSTKFGNRTEDKNVTSTGSYKATANQNGNAWVMHMVAFKADPGTPDTTPPSTPTNLTATATSSSQINLTWDASTDDIGVTGYKVFRNGTRIATATETSYNDTGLTASTTYDYTVSATDAAGNDSPKSAVRSATTLDPPADTTAPTLSLTAPANGATVSGTINVTADASDNVGVVGVQFLLDGDNLGAEDTTAPYSVSWNTSTATNGAHVLTARARDAADNTATSAARNVTVAAPDTSGPTVAITAPTNNAEVVDIVNVTADASDNVGVAGVQFLVDGVNNGVEDTTAPYVLAWDSRGVSNGAHTLTARARDAAGNSTLSAAVTVNVVNTNQFQNEVLATGFNLPTSIEFMPDGRMLVAELNGVIKVMSPPYTQVSPTPFLQIANIANTGVQQGIFDIALDPNFTSNHYYYVFFTANSPNRDRLSRFTANASLTGTVAGSELMLYEDPQTASDEHHGGAVFFDNAGKLFFTTGDHFQGTPSQQLTSPRGKLHRINSDGNVPTDNPFYDGTGPNVDSIWALGLRNPFRASYDAVTDRIYIGDVGGNDPATAKEEINLGARGANYGWPNNEGNCSAPCTSPIYFYPHNGRDASVTAGFVYRGSQYPSNFQGSFFYGDYGQNWIKRLTFDGSGNVTGSLNFEPPNGAPDGPYGDIVYLTQGPDGAIYYVDLGYSDDSGQFGVSKIRRIRYVQSNQAPIAIASGSPTTGSPPLDVTFSSQGSTDPEGQPLTYLWTFGDNTTSTQANPVHTYAQAGMYTARLTVSDGVNGTVSTAVNITVGSAPTATILSPTDGKIFVADDVISYSGEGTDPDDGALPASAFSWNIDFLHEGHVHPGTPIIGVKSGTFTIPTSGHDFEGNTRYRISLTVTDSDGLKSTRSVTIYPKKVDITFNTVPAVLTLYFDGIAKTTPFTADTLVGFRHNVEARNQTGGGSSYTFSSWSDGGAQQHDVVVPDVDRTYTATYTVSSAPVPITFKQLNYSTPQTNQSTVNTAYTGAQTAGNTNIIAIGWNSASGTISSVTDTAGNVYSIAAPLTRGGGNLSQAIYYAKNIAAAPAGNTVKVVFSGAMVYVDVRITEYAGLDPTNPVDVTSSSSGSNASATSGSVTTTAANALLFGAGMTWGYYGNATNGFTTRVLTEPNFDIVADRIVNSVGGYAVTAPVTGGGTWLMQLVAFKGAGGS
jgi:glucose/arabinose dehydrogenase/chitodextrinase